MSQKTNNIIDINDIDDIINNLYTKSYRLAPKRLTDQYQ